MPQKKRQGRIRIVGGSFRGRLLTVPEGVRPTSARARETLFNWLAPRIVGTRCLDLFAGAGALGLEALSRGAGECLFVDARREPMRMLQQVLDDWGAAGSVTAADAVKWLKRPRADGRAGMDIVFLDPPFGSGLAERCCTLLALNGWLAGDCRVYLETHKKETLGGLPSEWRTLRETVVGDARMVLAGRSAAE